MNDFTQRFLPQILFNIVEKFDNKQRQKLHDKVFILKTGNLDNLPDILENLVNSSLDYELLIKIVTLSLDISIEDSEIKNTLLNSEVLEIIDSETEYDMFNLMILYGYKLSEFI